jgi:tetratricopeptide (TPR) repeat protein
MDCKQTKELLMDYLYAELETESLRDFETHLDACTACRLEATGFSSVLSAVRSVEMEKPSDELSQRILHQARTLVAHNSHLRAAARVGFWGRWIRNPLAISAVLAAVMFSVCVVTFSPGPPALAPEELPSPIEHLTKPEEAHARIKQVANVYKKGTKRGETKKAKRSARGARRVTPRRSYSQKTARAQAKRKSPPLVRLAKQKASLDPERSFKKEIRNADRKSKIKTRVNKGNEQANHALMKERRAFAQAPPESGSMPRQAANPPSDRLSEASVHRQMEVTAKSDPVSQRFELAQTLFRQGKCEQSVEVASAALAIDPHHSMAAFSLFDQAACLIKLGRFEEANAVYRTIQKNFPNLREQAQKGLDRIPNQKATPDRH